MDARPPAPPSPYPVDLPDVVVPGAAHMEHQSARDSVAALFDAGKARIAAEKDLLQARGAVLAVGSKGTAIYGALAFAAGLVTFLMLGFGLMLILAHYLGPVWATLGTTLFFGGMATIFALLARRNVQTIKAAFRQDLTDEQ